MCEICVFLHFTNSQIGCVRPHIDFRAQIYNIFLNCANAQHIFCTKNAKKRKKHTKIGGKTRKIGVKVKKNAILFRYSRNYSYFCQR